MSVGAIRNLCLISKAEVAKREDTQNIPQEISVSSYQRISKHFKYFKYVANCYCSYKIWNKYTYEGR